MGATWPGGAQRNSVLVRNGLEPQELLDTPITVEPSEATGLCTTVRQRGFVVDRHRVDVNGAVDERSAYRNTDTRTSNRLTRFRSASQHEVLFQGLS